MPRSSVNEPLLDQSTNDPDTETLSALQKALEAFGGCAVIISHDRMFLDRLATHMLAFEGDSHVEWFQGNLEDYEKDKIRRLCENALTPKRIHFTPRGRQRAFQGTADLAAPDDSRVRHLRPPASLAVTIVFLPGWFLSAP